MIEAAAGFGTMSPFGDFDRNAAPAPRSIHNACDTPSAGASTALIAATVDRNAPDE
jgi:hypothetical protein